MTSFDDRKKAEEAHYSRLQEHQFKIEARRNKLLGLWAAEKLGLSGEKAAAYAADVVAADLAEPGYKDVIEKIARDLTAKNISIDGPALEKQLQVFEAEARKMLD